jgi:hypothetical protein
MDASCRWQQMQRDLMKQRPNYKGKGSMTSSGKTASRTSCRPIAT